MPYKSDCQPIFGIAQFVMQFKHVQRYFGALSRKQNNKSLEKTVLLIWSQTCKQIALILYKITYKNIICKTWF